MGNKTALDTQHDRIEQQPNLSSDAEGGDAPHEDNHHLSPVDWDFYGLSLEVELLGNYELGGYHPVHLGDTFRERYTVIHKLGFGGSGTVWLARDKEQNRYVALKILCAEISIDSHDVEILKFLEQRDDSGPGRQHIAFLLDHFQIEGPNGSHLCVVSEILGPALSQLALSGKQLRGSVARKVAHQAVEAVAWLHSHGICHGGTRSCISKVITDRLHVTRFDSRKLCLGAGKYRFMVRAGTLQSYRQASHRNP